MREIEGQLRIIAGTPTWAGQDLATCEGQIRTWGLGAFQSESQQEVGRAGAYFRQWDADRHVVPVRPLPAGWTYWGALDYGFAHPTVFYVLAKDGDGHLYVVGEHAAHRWLVEQHADAITALLERLGLSIGRLRRIVAGHDVFAQRGDRGALTIAEQYQQHGITLEPATIDRINGAAELQRRLGNPDADIAPTLTVFASCPRLIACLPRLVADPNRPEDVLKVDADPDTGMGGDDEFDCVRYGVMDARPAVTVPRPQRTVNRWGQV